MASGDKKQAFRLVFELQKKWLIFRGHVFCADFDLPFFSLLIVIEGVNSILPPLYLSIYSPPFFLPLQPLESARSMGLLFFLSSFLMVIVLVVTIDDDDGYE